MRIVFFGTGRFAIPTLEALIESRHKIVAVVTGPDKKSGRGYLIQRTPVKEFVESLSPDIHVLQPEKTTDAGFIGFFANKGIDLFVVVDYGRILKKELLDIPAKCCINLHPSLLPKYRGPAPTNWAVLNGETVTGNTVIRMSEKMDAGDIILRQKFKINKDMDAAALSACLARKAPPLVLKAVDLIDKSNTRFTRQNDKKATYAPKLKKEDGIINWSSSAEKIARQIKGTQPWPGSFTYLNGMRLKILSAAVVKGRMPMLPGRVCDAEKFIVSAKKDAIRVKRLQLEGKRQMETAEFLRGVSLVEGAQLK